MWRRLNYDWMREIGFRFRECHGQLAAGVYVAEKDIGHSIRTSAACVPRLGYCSDLIEPGHGYGRAGFEDDDGLGIGCDYCCDERVLIVRQREVGQVHAFAFPLLDEDDSYVGLAR